MRLFFRPTITLTVLCGLALAACGDRETSPAPSHVGRTAQGLTYNLPPAQFTNEDSPLFFLGGANAIEVFDSNPSITTQVDVSHGVFFLRQTPPPWPPLLITGNGTAKVNLTGAPWAINDVLNGSRFVPAPNYFTGDGTGPASLQLNSVTPDGGALVDSFSITVLPVNDPPVNGGPGSPPSATEDVPFTLPIPITDVDIDGDGGTNSLSVSLSASNSSTITLAALGGLTFTAGDGGTATSMSFIGTLSDVNAALNGITITPQTNYIGPSTLTITTDDRGSYGSGVLNTDTDVVTINWAPVNDAPVNTVPGPQTIAEEGQLTFSTAQGTALAVDDVDATTGLVQVTLSVTNGTLDLGNTGTVTFSVGDGVGDTTMTFSGVLFDLNQALQGTVFKPNPNFAGPAVLTLTTRDLGNSGAGGAKLDTDTVAITVTGVNDGPVHTVPGTQFTPEDIARVFSAGNGNLLAVTDVDAAGLLVTLTATNGTITLGNRNGLAFQVGDGIADATTTFTGTVAAVNAALSGLAFQPTANFYGDATLRIETSDQGSSGTGGALGDDDTVTITVTPVNDPPTALANAYTVAEDSGLGTYDVLLNDTIAPDVGESLTITAVSTPTNGVTAIVSNQVTYTPNSNFNGVDTFTYTVSDGQLTAVATVTVTVTTVNDPPTAVNDSVTVLRNTSNNAINVLANDSALPDVGETLIITAVSDPPNGTAVITGGGTGVSYTPDPTYSGPDSFTYTLSDQNGGTALGTVNVSVVALNEFPVNSLPGPQQIPEDFPLVFSSTWLNAITVTDATNPTLAVQVVVTNGTFTLGTTGGLTSSSGNGTATVNLSGTLAALNTALNNARFTPAANFAGTATLTITSSDTDAHTTVDVLIITVTADNDAPVNTVPAGPQAATEDTPKNFTGILVSDVDVGAALLDVTLTADNGTVLTLSQTAGLDFSTPGFGDGTANATMRFKGTQAAINSALNGLTVTPPANYIGNSTLTVLTSDQGASGAGGVKQDVDVVTIAWGAVNDPPVNGVPSAQTVVEESSLTFAQATANGLSVTDPDLSAAVMQVTLSATNGALTLGNPSLVTFSVGDGSADTTMTFSGTLSALNAALDATVFLPNADFAGTAVLTMTANDLGNSGGGGARQDTDTVTITVQGVNDAPVNALPVAQSTNEDVVRVFSTTNGNRISVTDSDATSLQVTLSATNGLLSLGSTLGLSFQAGDGTADATMTFSGLVAAVNAALNNLAFAPTPNYFGPATLNISTSDLGSSGSGGSRFDDDTLSITVNAVNDPPDARADTLAVLEDAAATSLDVVANDTWLPDAVETLTVSAVSAATNGTTAIVSNQVTYTPNPNFFGADSFTYTLSDGYGGTDTALVTVTVTGVNDPPNAVDDTLTVLQNAGATPVGVLSNDSTLPDTGETLTITSVSTPSNGTAVVTGGGTGVSYTPAPGWSGPDSFTYTISDGNGGVATATVSVTVTAVITAPVNTIPPPQTTVEDTPLYFSVASANPITVADANSPTLTVQVVVTNGVFNLGSLSGLTSQTGNGTATVTFQGSLANLNNALNNARFTPAANYSGPASLTITSTDSGGENAVNVLTLTVTSVNDAPVNTVPAGTQAATEDVPRTFTGIRVSDVDASPAPLQVTLTADNGTVLTLAQTSGLTFTAGGGTASPAMTFTGTQAAINAALNGLTVTPPTNYIGNSTLQMLTTDLGASGAGGPAQDSDTITLNWVELNDPPVNVVPAAQTVAEEATLTFSLTSANGLSVSDTDLSAGVMQVTLTCTNGIVTLGSTAGLATVAGNASPTVVLTGTQNALNAALEGTVYAPNTNFAGAALLTMTSNDLGNTGSGGSKQDVDTVAITVAGVNDAPVLTVPGPQGTNEDVVRVFSSSNGNRISATDVDATSLQVTLSATVGTLTLGSTSGLTFQSGDGNADATMTFTGLVAVVNAALGNLTFAPPANYNGPVVLSVSTTDLGSSGTGGALGDAQTVAITVQPINDPPDAVFDLLTVAEDAPATTLDVVANDTWIPDAVETLTVSAVSTPANGTTAIVSNQVTYQPNANFHGTDTFTYTLSDGNGGTDTATVTVTVTSVNDPPVANDDTFTTLRNASAAPVPVLVNDSTLPDLGETLTIVAASTPTNGTVVITGGGTGLTYQANSGYTGGDSFTYTISDGALTATATVTVTVVDVNSNPINSVPGPQQFLEDNSRYFTVGNNNVISVTDADTGSLNVQIVVTNGTFTLGSTANVSPVGNGTSTVSMSGLIANLNNALLNSRYTPTLNFNGTATLTITTNDGTGNSAINVVTLIVDADNDPPINAVTGGLTQSSNEDTPKSLVVSVDDVDVGVSPLQVTLVANNGTRVSLVTVAGLAITTGTGLLDSVMVFQGSRADINTALNGVTITPQLDYAGPSSLTVTTNDLGSTGLGGPREDIDVVNLTWNATNDAPINLVPVAQTVLEDTTLTFSAATGTALTFSDSDASPSAVVQVTLGVTNGTLTLGTTSGLTTQSGNGTTTITMTGTTAALIAAMDGTVFSPTANFAGAAVLTMTTRDQGNSPGTPPGQQDVDTVAITVTAVNDPPVNSVPGAQSVSEDQTLLMTANQFRVTDPDATSVQVTLTASTGVLTLGTRTGVTYQAGDGLSDPTITFTGTPTAVNTCLASVTYTPPNNYNGGATLTLYSSDLGGTGLGGAQTDLDLVSVTVLPVNDNPSAGNDTYTVAEDSTTDFQVLLNDSTAPDVGETLTIISVAAGANGTVTTDGTVVTYRPNANYFGSDAFTYTVSDGSRTSTGSVSVTITAVNDPPDALDNAYSLPEYSAPTTYSVLANDTASPDIGETLTIVSTTQPVNGTVTVNVARTQVTYQPNPGFIGVDTFTYTISDGNGGTDTATVTMTVTDVDFQPVAVADSLTVSEDGSGTVAVLANDSQLGDAPVSVLVATTPTRGSAVVQTGNTILYTPNANAFGSDSFTYRVTDADGDQATATVTVTITAVNDPPDAVNDTASVPEASAATQIAVLGNDTAAPDVGETLVVTAVSTAANGTTAVAGGGTSVTYRPNAGFVGIDTFTYTISDGNGGTDTATVTVTVTDVDFQPVAVADTLTVAEDSSGTATVLANDSGLGDAPVVVTVTTAPARGTAVVQTNNTVLYTPSANAFGADSFGYTVTDADGDTATATVTVTITAVNDVPTAVADTATTAEDTSARVVVLANDTGAVDTPLTVTVTAQPANGTATVEADNAITYRPSANWSGTDAFSYQVQDADGQTSTAAVTVTVTPVNDVPVAVADTAAALVATPVEVDVLANDTDADGDTLTVASVTQPTNGTATIEANGRVRYSPAAAFTGNDQFSYTVGDGNGATATANVLVAVGLDGDSDGLLDADEIARGTDPADMDTDDDLINDGLEVNTTRTNPLDDDTDDDGLLDGNEDLDRDGTLDPAGPTGAIETDPTKADTDGDGVQDGTEKGLAAPQGSDTVAANFNPDLDPATKTDPQDPDTDNGGLKDGEEDINANGRVDTGEKNPLLGSDDVPGAPDADADGVPDATDNCPTTSNADQTDTDRDGAGDVCDSTPRGGGCGCGAADQSATGTLALAGLLLAAWLGRRRRVQA